MISTYRIAGRPYQAKSREDAEEQDKAYKASLLVPKWEHTILRSKVCVSPELYESCARQYSSSPSIKGGLQKFSHLNEPFKTKLEKAIQTAPIMVREALKLLNEHKSKRDQTATHADLDYTPVGEGLVKYFNLSLNTPSTRFPATGEYWRYVDGIISVFEKIRAGLDTYHRIELGVFDSRGRVRGWDQGRETVSAIRQTFGFADEYGHREYTGFNRFGHIEISFSYLCDNLTTFEMVARTIVHEASHKFALTKDVLYKHQSFGKTLDLSSEDQTVRRESAITRPRSDNKKMDPMLGREKNTTNLVLTERWLENADSYAWLARRLWKRSGRLST